MSVLRARVKGIGAWLWKKKWWVLIVCVVLGIGLVWAYKKYFSHAGVPEYVSNDYLVAKGDVSNALTMNGTTQFAHAQKLTFVKSGRVTAVNTKIGETVKKGQVLATLSAEAQDKKVDTAKKALKNAQKALKKKMEDLDSGLMLLQAQADYDAALLEYQNLPANQLLDMQGKKSEVDSAKAAIKDAQLAYQSAQDDYAFYLSGSATAKNEDLIMSETLRARNSKLTAAVNAFRDEARDLEDRLRTYDMWLNVTDELAVRDNQDYLYIGAQNLNLLLKAKRQYWAVDKYVPLLRAEYDKYKDIPVEKLSEDQLLISYKLFNQLGLAMVEWGKVNAEMVMESIEHAGLSKQKMYELSKTYGVDYEKAGESYMDKYQQQVGVFRDLAKGKDSEEGKAIDVENKRIALEKAKLSYEKMSVELSTLEASQKVALLKKEKELKDLKKNLNELKENAGINDEIEPLQDAVDSAQLELTTVLKEYEDYKIIANFDGVVTKLNMQVGDSIGSSSASSSDEKYIYVETPDLLEVQLEVDQIDIVKIHLGMPVQVYVDALPDVMFEGRFSEIDTMSE